MEFGFVLGAFQTLSKFDTHEKNTTKHDCSKVWGVMALDML